MTSKINIFGRNENNKEEGNLNQEKSNLKLNEL